MNKLWVILFVTFISFNTSALTVMGNQKCSDVNQDTKSWILGFLSGIAVQSGKDLLNDSLRGPDSFVNIIVQRCKVMSPNESVAEVALSVLKELDKERSKVSPNTTNSGNNINTPRSFDEPLPKKPPPGEENTLEYSEENCGNIHSITPTKQYIANTLKISINDVSLMAFEWDPYYSYGTIPDGIAKPAEKCVAIFDTRVGPVYCRVGKLVKSSEVEGKVFGNMINRLYSARVCNFQRTQGN